MRLQLLLPTHIELDEEVSQVTAEALTGSFTLLPRHVDYAAPLAAGILAYETASGESFVAINGGVLVKTGEHVRVVASEAVEGRDLASLKQAIGEKFEQLSESESRAQSAVQRIEADFVRRFIQLEESAQA